MAFTIANWTCVSASLNQGQETVTPYGGSPTVLNAPNLFTYGSPTDALATIAAANYFLSEYASLCVGDIIIVNGTDGSNMYIVATSTSTDVTVNSFTASGSVATANIQNNAVTYAKFQQVAASSLVGNPTNALANAQGITLGNGLEFTGTTLDVPNTNLIYAAVAITAAQFNGMYAAPKLLVAAPGANKLIVLERAVLAMTFVSAAYAAGGVVAFQWDSTVHGAGQHASNTEAAADFFAAASSAFMFVGNSGNASTVDGGLVPFTANVNKGLYLSNLTGAFTTGDSTWIAHLWYKIIPTV
jgi:Repeat of unknown function (DUF5907)